MRKKQIILPRVHRPENGDRTKWNVFFSVYDEYTGQMHRFQKKKGFAACKSDQERERNAKLLVNFYTKKLKNGWDPFVDDSEIIWNDSLVYNSIKKVIKPTRRTKKTIPYYMNDFINQKEHQISKATYDTYRSKFRTFSTWLNQRKLDQVDISVFSKEDAECFVSYLINKKKLKNKTINAYLLLINQVWKHVQKSRKLIVSPFAHIEKLKETTKPQIPLKRGVIQLLKSELESSDPQLWLAAQFMYYCFIRPKELRFMQIKHIDLYEGRITLYPDITKHSKTRTVDIGADFLEKLFNEYQLHTYPEDHYVFTTEGKPGIRPVSKNYFWSHFDKIRKRLKLPNDYKFYSFKHTGAVAALKAGADIKEIQHQMGHSSVAITDEYLKSMVGWESEFFKKKMPEL